MGIWRGIKTAASNFLHRDRLESDLDAEIHQYVAAVAAEKIDAGMSPAEARRKALAEMGGMEQVRQAVRESRTGTSIELIWQDVRYGMRMLWRNPSFTWTAVITLGLGIGSTTSIFSAVYSLVLRPLPYFGPDQLVSVTGQSLKFRSDVLISPDFVAAQHALKSFSHFAGYWWANRNLTGSGDPTRIVWVGVTATFLPALGVTPQLGRIFSEMEDHPAGPALILLSDRIWRSQFQADPHIVGRSVTIDGTAETIIGVLPASFSFPNYGLEPDIYAPADIDPDTNVSAQKGVMGIFSMGRLRPGVSAEQAQSEMQAFFERRGRAYPAGFEFLSNGRQAVVESLSRHLMGDDRRPLWILFAAVAGVLLNANRNFEHDLLPRLESLPGVKAAALVSVLPLGYVDGSAVSFTEDPNPPIGLRKVLTTISVTPDYFQAVGTSMIKGRVFDNRDTPTSSRVAIVNLAFAKQFFAGDAVGRQFNIGQSNNGQFRFLPTTIVGIAENVRHNGLMEKAQPEFYVPMDQTPSQEVDLILRTGADPVSLSNAMREAVIAVDHDQPLFDVETMEERLSNLVAQRKLMMSLVACFASLAVILAAVGVFGVFAYSVSQRTQEMGIRLALGASRGSLLRLIVTQAARLIVFGGAIGIGAAFLLSRLLASALVGITPHDALSFSLAWIVMTLIALFASIVPALVAARTDLLSVLRSE